MNEQDFKKMDDRWMEDLKNIREKKVPEKILEGFAASVEARLREEKKTVAEKAYGSKSKRFFIPMFIPAFAVLIIGSLLVLKAPLSIRSEAGLKDSVQLASAIKDTADLSEEAAVLREVGAWTDEDEMALGVSDDEGLNEIELSKISSAATRFLA